MYYCSNKPNSKGRSLTFPLHILSTRAWRLWIFLVEIGSSIIQIYSFYMNNVIVYICDISWENNKFTHGIVALVTQDVFSYKITTLILLYHKRRLHVNICHKKMVTSFIFSPDGSINLKLDFFFWKAILFV